jgi:hypothetical protein
MFHISNCITYPYLIIGFAVAFWYWLAFVDLLSAPIHNSRLYRRLALSLVLLVIDMLCWPLYLLSHCIRRFWQWRDNLE